LRWKDRPLHCPRCQSLNVGPWGPYQAQPGLQRYRGKEKGCQRPFNDLTGTRLDGSTRSVLPWILATFLLCLACASRRIAREVGAHVRTRYRWCWWLRHAALSYESGRKGAGTVEADALYHPAGHKGQAKTGGTQSWGRTPRGRRKQREPGRGHDDKERPASLVGGSRPGGVVLQATRDLTGKTVPKAAALARPAGRQRSTDSARRYRLRTGEAHDAVYHTQQEDARGEGHEKRAEGLFAGLQSSVRVCRGSRTTPLPGDVGFVQFRRHCHQRTALEQAERIV
jgi:transposase-like protein